MLEISKQSLAGCLLSSPQLMLYIIAIATMHVDDLRQVFTIACPVCTYEYGRLSRQLLKSAYQGAAHPAVSSACPCHLSA